MARSEDGAARIATMPGSSAREERDVRTGRGGPNLKALAKSFWVQAGLCMLGAALVRTAFLLRAQGMLDGDEAVLGIQAEQILRGAHPVYFAGQVYMGALDAYLIAPLVALLGPSAWALRLPVLLESLLLIPLSGALAQRLYGRRARLPALVLAAVPALYVTVGQLRVLGGYIETFLFGTLSLLLVVILVERVARRQPSLGLVAALGLVGGVAIWTDSLFLEYVGAIGIWTLPLVYGWARRTIASGSIAPRRLGLGALACIGGGLAGFSPALFFAFRNQFANLTWLLRGGQQTPGASVAHISDPLRLGVLRFMLTRGLPRLAGSYPLWSPLPPIHALQHIGLACVVLALVYTLGRFVNRLSTTRYASHRAAAFRHAWNFALAPILLVVVTVLYWRSSLSDGYVFSFDRTGRYLLVAATAMTLMVASLFGDLPVLVTLLARRAQRWRAPGWRGIARVIHAPFARVVATLALAGLVLANVLPYATANAVLAMQSPFRPADQFPTVDRGLITYLEQHHIRYIWGDHWFNYVAEYLSDGQIVAADYLKGERFPENLAEVERADRPSYVIRADPSAGECDVARMLDQMHVTYRAVPFTQYWVITPLSRTVQPEELTPVLSIGY